MATNFRCYVHVLPLLTIRHVLGCHLLMREYNLGIV